MRKYLVNYRVDYNPCCEFTAIYEVESMMTQEDVEAFEEAKTKEHGRTATMVSFHELGYAKPKKETLPRLAAFVLYDTEYHEKVLVYTNEDEVEKYYVDENTGEKFIVLVDPRTGKKREDIHKVCPISWLTKYGRWYLFSMEYEHYKHTNTYA